MRVGQTVEVINDDPWTGEVGKIAAIVFSGKQKQYIVQFKRHSEWSYFNTKNLRAAKLNKVLTK